MNDKKESISAKLRRWSDESMEKHEYPTTTAERELGCENPSSMVSERELFLAIADETDAEKSEITERYARQSWMNPADAIARVATGEIEWSELKEAIDRYYLPRPLFEDGEPVQLGDTVVDKLRGEMLVTRMSWVGNGVYFNGSHDRSGKKLRTSRIAYARVERVRRPEPRVLDADGVPIEVGDTVWKVGCKHAYGVCEIDESKFYDVLVVRKDCGLMNRFYHDKLTHREPDSLKKPLNDIRGYLAESPCIDVHVRPWEQRLTALVELDGRDA